MAAASEALRLFGRRGYGVSPNKVQTACQSVRDPGRELTPTSLSPEPPREKGQSCPSPFRPRRNRFERFSETTGSGRLRIPRFGFLAKPLHDPTRGIDSDHAEVPETLKTDPTATPSPDLPGPGEPFIPYVDERRGQASGVLTRSLGPDPRPGDVPTDSKDASLALRTYGATREERGYPTAENSPTAHALLRSGLAVQSSFVLSGEIILHAGEAVFSRYSFRTYLARVRLTSLPGSPFPGRGPSASG